MDNDEEMEQPTEEEIESLIQEDPDLSLDPNYEAPEEEEIDLEDGVAPKRALKVVPPAIDKETMDLLADIKSGKYTSKQPEYAPEPRYEAPKPQPNQGIDFNAAINEFSEDIMIDPKKAAAKLFGTMMVMNKQSEDRIRTETEAQYAPMASSAAESAISRASAEFEKNPNMTPEVRQEFSRLVEAARKSYGPAIARMSSEDIKKGLKSAFAEAIGNVAMDGKRVNRATPAPKYAPSSGGNSRGSTRSAPSLSDDERDVVRNMRSAGIDAKSIKEAIRELRAEAS